MNNINTSAINDKPSLHWSQDVMKKVNKQIQRNAKFNFSPNATVYKKVPSFYEIEWKDFLPLFLGWCHSLFMLSYTYGLIRSTTIFNKQLYKLFRNKLLLACLIHFIFGPILIFFLIFFTPLMAIESSQYYHIWGQLGKIPLNEWTIMYSEQVFLPYFNSNAWYICLSIFIFLPCLNVSTLLTSLIFNVKNDNYLKLFFLEDELKMKLTNFKKNG